MAYVFRFPDVGEGLTEAEVVEWFVDVGSYVAADAALVSVETDKVQVEISAPVAGFLLARGAEEAEVIEVGAMLAVIGKAGEEWPEPPHPHPTGLGEVLGVNDVDDPPLVGTLSESARLLEDEFTEPVIEAAPELIPELPRALPLVRKLAIDNGIDISEVKGSGPSGQVTRADVEAKLEVDTEMVDKTIRMSATRRVISANMARSWREIPHVTTFDEFDAGKLLRSREALCRRHDTNIPLDALIVAAALPVLIKLPSFNASLQGENLTFHSVVHAGVAINTERGLMVGVVHDAQALGLWGISSRVQELSEKGGANRLTVADLAGATFTISNIGVVGGGLGTPLIPYGTTAILSVGAAKDKPVVAQGEVVVASMAPLSLSYDHRVIDGVTGRRFIELLKENLEEPILFLE